MKIRVYYEDTDIGGIVYHTNYIKYCERARSEIFFQKNLMPTLGERSGFVVRNLNASFISTSSLGDLLTVASKVVQIKRSSILLLQEIYKTDKKIFSMEISLVYLESGKPCLIPETFKNVFQSFI